MRAVTAGCAFVFGAAALTACSVLVGLNGLAGTADAAAGDAQAADASAEGASSTDASQTLDGGVDGATNDCPSTAGEMIRVDGYCIDATEVTNDEYGKFIVAKNGNTAGQPTACAWNTAYAPSCAQLVKTAKSPVSCIDWCDAYAFCAWAGKRLCGRIGGGPTALADLASANVD